MMLSAIELTKRVAELLNSMREEPVSNKALKRLLDGALALNLYGQKLSMSDIKHLSKALKHNKTITSLNLGLNQIRAEGAQVLAQCLEKNNTLKVLDLQENILCTKGAEYLVEGLKWNLSIEILNLRRNQIGSNGVSALAGLLRINNTLKSLDIGQNNLHWKIGIHALAEALKLNKTLNHLYLGDNQIGCEGTQWLAIAFKESQSLERLDLNSNLIKDKGVLTLIDSIESIAHKLITYNGINVSNNDIKNSTLLALHKALTAHETDMKKRAYDIGYGTQRYLPLPVATIVADYVATVSKTALLVNFQRGIDDHIAKMQKSENKSAKLHLA